MATKPQKNLAAIHIAQKALGLSADDAAALKLSVVGVASSKDMTLAQQKRYLAHLSGLQERAALARGEQPAYRVKPRPAHHIASADDCEDRWHKARAMWAALARAGSVRTDTDAALLAYVKRQTQKDAWRWLNTHEINTVIEALKRWAKRTGVSLDGAAA